MTLSPTSLALRDEQHLLPTCPLMRHLNYEPPKVAKKHATSLEHFNTEYMYICDRIWENSPYGIRARFAQCAFLVAQVEICQSPEFVVYISNNPSSNCCHLHSRRTRSPLLWAVIRILYLDTARFIELLYIRSPF